MAARAGQFLVHLGDDAPADEAASRPREAERGPDHGAGAVAAGVAAAGPAVTVDEETPVPSPAAAAATRAAAARMAAERLAEAEGTRRRRRGLVLLTTLAVAGIATAAILASTLGGGDDSTTATIDDPQIAAALDAPLRDDAETADEIEAAAPVTAAASVGDPAETDAADENGDNAPGEAEATVEEAPADTTGNDGAVDAADPATEGGAASDTDTAEADNPEADNPETDGAETDAAGDASGGESRGESTAEGATEGDADGSADAADAADAEPLPEGPVPESKAVVKGGQIFLEGAVPNQAAADAIVEIAAAVLGPDNVINNYVIDPRAGDPNLGNVRVDDTVLFETGSAVIAKEFEPLLGQAVALMTIRPSVTLTIVGHTDSVGPDDFNLELSIARAESVVAWLMERGVDPARLTAEGRGESEPIASNDTEAGKQLNRRIQVFIENLLADDS